MIKIQHDVATDTITEIAYTAQEIKAVEADKIRFAKIAEEAQKEIDAIKLQKKAILDRLGITADEAKLLLS